jgi:hypothetical protein
MLMMWWMPVLCHRVSLFDNFGWRCLGEQGCTKDGTDMALSRSQSNHGA